MTILPQGNRILVLPMKKENHVTSTNLELVDNGLEQGEVVEFAPMFNEVYKKGDIILYPKDSGLSQQYNKKLHLFMDGRGYGDGSVFAIIGNVNEK